MLRGPGELIRLSDRFEPLKCFLRIDSTVEWTALIDLAVRLLLAGSGHLG